MQGPIFRLRSRAWLTAVSVLFLASSWSESAVRGQESDDSKPANAIYDHHVHVMSPQLIGHWKALGASFSREEAVYSDPERILESQNLSRAFIVSMAHLYASEELASLDEISGRQLEWLQKENDFVNECVLKAPDRLIGFASVQPLWEGVIEEIDRCRRMEGITGVKLHFPACGVDLADPEHVKLLQLVFAHANDRDMPLLIHLFQADQANAAELARLFWEELVAPNVGMELYLAHLGAAGGYNTTSAAVLNSFQTLRDSSSEYALRKVFFDLSGAILVTETDGIQPTTDDNCRLLAEQIGKTGIHHFLFASDFPVFNIETTVEALKTRLPLSAEETDKLIHSKSERFARLAELGSIDLPDLRNELLVQHADQDAEFQQRCLDLMTAEGTDEVKPADIAYLTDRVLVAGKKPQRFGTQANTVDGKLEIAPCEDPENLDARRAELGLPPIAEYLEIMRKAYGIK